MAKRLFDRLALFGWARLDVTTAAGPVRFTAHRYAVFHMRDPSRLRDEAVVTLHELLNLGVRGHFSAKRQPGHSLRGPPGASDTRSRTLFRTPAITRRGTDWNTPSIRFYRKLGATLRKEWILTRLAGAPLRRLARLKPTLGR